MRSKLQCDPPSDVYHWVDSLGTLHKVLCIDNDAGAVTLETQASPVIPEGELRAKLVALNERWREAFDFSDSPHTKNALGCCGRDLRFVLEGRELPPIITDEDRALKAQCLAEAEETQRVLADVALMKGKDSPDGENIH